MNVNQLADQVEMWGKDLLALNMAGGVPVIKGAKMLRQQQAEIEDLKSRIYDAIAWMDVKEWNSVDREILLDIFRGEK